MLNNKVILKKCFAVIVNIGYFYVMELNPEIKESLVKIANGREIKYLKNACVEINNIVIHCRFVTNGLGKDDKEKFSFNINQTTLTADYELWVCGSSNWYYLIPIKIINDIYDDPDTYTNKYPGQSSMKTVGIVITDNEIKFETYFFNCMRVDFFFTQIANTSECSFRFE